MFNVAIRPDGQDEIKFVSSSRDVSFWERTVHGASLGNIERNGRMADIESLAYSAARRRKLIPDDVTLDRFRETCDVMVTSLDSEDGVDPTRTGH